jgi:DNA-directed RNA polymerase specialized sigma24 family protein
VSNTDLLTLLDADPATASAKYEDLSLRLRKFFQWRNCGPADDLAQETLRRGFARIASGVSIYADDVTHYFFGIAKNVARERRTGMAESFPLDEEPVARESSATSLEARICLEQCLRLLEAEERDLLVRYHTEDRDDLARTLSLSDAALRVRVHRTRRKLEKLVQSART